MPLPGAASICPRRRVLGAARRDAQPGGQGSVRAAAGRLRGAAATFSLCPLLQRLCVHARALARLCRGAQQPAQLRCCTPSAVITATGPPVSTRLLAPYKEMQSCPPRSTLQVDFYLKLLEDREDSQKQGTAAKNRRLAYMNRWGAPWCGRAEVPLTPLLRTAAAAGAQQLPRAQHPAPRIPGYLRLLQPGHAHPLPARPPPAGCCRRALSSRTRR